MRNVTYLELNIYLNAEKDCNFQLKRVINHLITVPHYNFSLTEKVKFALTNYFHEFGGRRSVQILWRHNDQLYMLK